MEQTRVYVSGGRWPSTCPGLHAASSTLRCTWSVEPLSIFLRPLSFVASLCEKMRRGKELEEDVDSFLIDIGEFYHLSFLGLD